MADADGLTHPSRHRHWIGGLVIVAVIAAIYFPAVSFPFYNWDDQETLSGNPWLNPVSIGHVREILSRPYMSLYVPVTYLLWSGIALVAGAGGRLNPAVFHAANVLLHVAASLTVYAVLLRLFRNDWASLAGAMIFTAHPVQVEAVVWTSGTKDLLGGLLSLLSTYTHLRATGASKASGNSWRAASVILFILAMLSKPSAVALPLVLLAIDRFLLRKSSRQALLIFTAYAALATPIAVVGKLVQSAEWVQSPPVWQRVSVAGDTLLFYARQILAPVHLMIDYGRSPQWLLAQPWAAVSWMGLLVLVVAIWMLRRRAPWAAAGFAVFGAALLPVLGFLPFEFQIYSTVGDHYLYFALFGPALIFAGTVNGRGRSIVAVAFVAMAVLAVRSGLQVRVWSDDQRLFQHNLELNPTSLAATRTLGFLAARDRDPAMAAAYYELALTHHPDDSITHYNFGNLLLSVQQYPLAVEHFRRAVELRPERVRYRSNLGIALIAAGNLPDGVAELRKVVEATPNSAEAHFNLGKALKRAGDPEAEREFRRASELDPTSERVRSELAPR